MAKHPSKTQLRSELSSAKAAIKAKCLDCMCGQKINCEIEDCTLYPFNPLRRKAK